MIKLRNFYPLVLVLLGSMASLSTLAIAQAPNNTGNVVNVSLPGGPAACSDATLKKIAFGVGSSAYQVEGAAATDGRTPSIWDTYSKATGKIQDGTTGDIATDFYNHYPMDIALMKSLGVKNFRMSISWSRLIPKGRANSTVNPKAVAFYNNVFKTLKAAGISPAVTLYHWDLPQVLQDVYQGFLSRQIIDDYIYYADQAFQLFGGRVKKWTTFNEPWITCNLQYGNGDFAPGVKYGDEGKWKCGHHLLLAHAQVYKLYKAKYQAAQGGKVGMALWSEWTEPWTNSTGDIRAAQNRMDVDFGWMADPIHFGDYPALVKKSFASFLPTFTEAEKALLRKSYDYLGITLYTGKYAREIPTNPNGWWIMNQDVNGRPLGEQAQSSWLYNVPWSLSRMLEYMDKRYDRPELWVLENGISEKGEAGRTGAAALRDPLRIRYFSGYLGEVCKCVDRGVKFTHYLAWSFTDNWEWREGFQTRFGIVNVDFKSRNLTRTVKDSGRWMSQHVFNKSSKK